MNISVVAVNLYAATMKLVSVIVTTFLPEIFAKYFVGQEEQLIQQLTNRCQFDHHLILLDSTVDANRFISTDGLTPRTVYAWNGDDDNGNISLELNSKNCFMIVALDALRLDRTTNLRNVMQIMQRHRLSRLKIGLLITQMPSVEDLLILFEDFRNSSITNIFVVTHFGPDSEKCSLNMFTFHPFDPDSELLNVTASDNDDDRFDDYFQDKNANFYEKELILGGGISPDLVGYLWMDALDDMNALHEDIEIDDLDVDDTEAYADTIDVLGDLFVPKRWDQVDIYPIEIAKVVVLVP